MLVEVTSIVVVLKVERVVPSTSILFESAFCFPFDLELSEVVVTGSTILVLSFFVSFYCKKDSLLLLVCLFEKLDNIFQDKVGDCH